MCTVGSFVSFTLLRDLELGAFGSSDIFRMFLSFDFKLGVDTFLGVFPPLLGFDEGGTFSGVSFFSFSSIST